MKNCSYTRSSAHKLTVKGELSEDCNVIKYVDGDKNVVELEIEKCLKPFSGQSVEFTVAVKTNEDLSEDLDWFDE